MAAPRPKKKAPVKKKPPAKKKPSFLRKDTPRPARDLKPGDMRSQVLKNATSKAGVARGLIKKIPVIGAAAGFIVDAAPAGVGSDKPSGPLMKSNMPGGYGSKTSGYGPTPKKKASAIMPKSSMAGGGVNKPGDKSSSDTLRKAGAGTYTASYDVKAKKSGSSKAASVAPAKASSGTSKAATKTKRRSPTRYQRDETAMEQKLRKG